MSLEVRLTRGAPPRITVSGQTPAPMHPHPWHDVQQGREDLLQRVMHYQGCGRPAGVHLSAADGLPGQLAGTCSRNG